MLRIPIQRSALAALTLAALMVLVLGPAVLLAQEPGDQVLLRSSNPQGVPIHPVAGDMSFVRWANGSEGEVIRIDEETGWFLIQSGSDEGWVVGKYLTILETGPESGEGEEIPYYVFGTWNLEHLHDGQKRGFPEYIRDGPVYPPRSHSDYRYIADIIRNQLFARALILNEIDGDSPNTSEELTRLLDLVGEDWTYVLTESGGDMRVAFAYDSTAVRKRTCVEFEVEEQSVDDKDIFARDPLACYVSLLSEEGHPMNDLVVVGLHLASGQRHADNHDRAMEILARRLRDAFHSGTFPPDEADVLIGGDLNASRYDLERENFWAGYESGDITFRTLAPEDPTDYPGTRLAGVPLYPRSQIDYLIASSQGGGLAGEELVRSTAHVHLELLPPDFTKFRRRASDHLPVTVRIRVQSDTDAR